MVHLASDHFLAKGAFLSLTLGQDSSGCTDIAKKLWVWWTQKSKRDKLLETIDQVRLFEEWEAAAFSLDECMDYDMWSVHHLISHATLSSPHMY